MNSLRSRTLDYLTNIKVLNYNSLKCFSVDDVCTNFEGVVHLEALDLLSKECESKVNLKAGRGLGIECSYNYTLTL